MGDFFDVFRGDLDKDPQWLDIARSFAGAGKRMEEIVAAVPDHYFAYGVQSSSILGQIDTRTTLLPSIDRKADCG